MTRTGRREGKISGERFKALCDVLGWSIEHAAREFTVEPRQARRWASGEYPVPDSIVDWIEGAAAHRLANPPPAAPARGNGQ